MTGAEVRRRRVAAGLSLREVAKALGVSDVHLGAVERGVVASLDEEQRQAFIALERASKERA